MLHGTFVRSLDDLQVGAGVRSLLTNWGVAGGRHVELGWLSFKGMTCKAVLVMHWYALWPSAPTSWFG